MKAPWCGSWGIRTPGTVKPVRQFSKLVVSATHPNFLFLIFMRRYLSNAMQRYYIFLNYQTFLQKKCTFIHFFPVFTRFPFYFDELFEYFGVYNVHFGDVGDGDFGSILQYDFIFLLVEFL